VSFVAGQYPKVNEERKRRRGEKAERSKKNKIAEMLLLY
jgi:hypothetical protein